LKKRRRRRRCCSEKDKRNSVKINTIKGIELKGMDS